uniref:EB domain-containing protein n=1 Tax=Elaeophora elaphi TaxID=1147741 RepID=A0A0R3S2T1_9BILA
MLRKCKWTVKEFVVGSVVQIRRDCRQISSSFGQVSQLSSSSSGIANVGEVGAFCNSDPHNLLCITPNTFCINNICTCAPSYEHVNGECILKSSKTLASNCKTSAECVGRGEYCNRSSGKCLCLSTHFILGGKCMPVIYPGQSGCEDSRQCNEAYPGAICTSQQKCQCPKGFKAKAFSCFKSKRYAPQRGRSRPLRLNSYDQSSFIQKAKFNLPVHGTAVSSLCPAQQIFLKEAGICMAVRRPGESCQYSEQCAAVELAAFCEKLTCKCAPGMKLSGKSCTFIEPRCALLGYVWVSELAQCMQVLLPGTNGCSHSMQCSAATDGAYCSRNKCTCPGTLIPTEGTCGEQCQANMVFSAVVGKCIPAIKPGGKCQYSSQCQMSDAEMVCARGICRCYLDKVFTGDRCAENCPFGHTVSKNGICRKGCSWRQIEYNDECFDQMLTGQRCLMDSECVGGFRCVNNICVCPSSMMIREGLCRQKEVGPMESCDSGEVCLGGSSCLAGICKCPLGSMKSNEECVPHVVVPPSSTCNSTIQCSGGSSCIANICQCPNFQQSVNGICKLPPAVPVGSACTTGTERCLGGSKCLFGICECPFGTVAKSGECVLEQKVLIESPCDSNQVCLGIANCIDGICQCPFGMAMRDGECHDLTLIGAGDSCANGEFCSGGSICIKSICLCPIGTTNQNGICVAEQTVNYDKICISGEICLGDLFCIDGICQCPQGTFLTSGQCISATGTCINLGPYGLCHCPAGEIFLGDRCQMIFAEPGESCLNGETCISNYVCINGSCLCLDGEVSRDGNCVQEDNEIRKYANNEGKPNSPCSGGKFCTGGSFCNVVDGMCRCPADTILQNGKCEHINAQSLLMPPPRQIFNRRKDVLKKPLNHSVINVTRITLHMSRCVSNNDCKGGAYCFGYRCICPFNMIMKDGICQRMVPISHGKDRIGKRCTINQDCVMRNTECHRGICTCLRGHHISGDSGCIPRAMPFSNNHPQTVVPTVTTASIDLSNSITERATDEVIDSGLEEVDSDQTGLQSAMLTALPLIDAGIEHIPKSRLTEVIVNISGGVCNETTLCLFFSICRNGICKCPLGTRISDTECKFMADVSRLQQFEKLLHGGYSILAYATRPTLPSKPQITHQHVLPAVTTAIHPISPVKAMTTSANRIWSTKEVWSTVEPKLVTSMSIAMRPGAYCEDAKAYCTNGSVCIENQCVCMSNDIMINGACVPRIHVRCETTQQCPFRSHCIDGQCFCIPGTAMSRYGFCIPVDSKSSPGMPCTNGERCTGFSKCIHGMCTCPPERNNIDNVPFNSAVLLHLHGGKNRDCSDDSTICRDGTYCLKGSCVCPTGHICNSTEAIAQQGKVKYGEDYLHFKYVQLVNVGGHCDEADRSMQCWGNSICANGFCTCPSGERLINDICTSINSRGQYFDCFSHINKLKSKSSLKFQLK